MPQAESGAGFGVLFVIGLLSGVHCIGMCGGIMLTQKNAVAYNAGRLLSYTALGRHVRRARHGYHIRCTV